MMRAGFLAVRERNYKEVKKAGSWNKPCAGLEPEVPVFIHGPQYIEKD